MAREIHRGELKVHAWSALTTHLHALVESANAGLSDSMRRILNPYSRRFNRQRKRDGPLFRGRFRSTRVGSDAYRALLHSYIDDNPVAAGIVADARHYPYGSARDYARLRGPRWLDRAWAETQASGAGPYEPEAYRRRFATRLDAGIRQMVARRLRMNPADDGELDSLVDAAPERVREWMERKSRLADGTLPGVPVVPPEHVEADVEAARRIRGQPLRISGQRRVDGWQALNVGLLRTVCGLHFDEISLRLDLPRTTVRDRATRHRRAIQHDRDYADVASAVAHQSLRIYRRNELGLGIG
ncbi:MAG: transposase [Planctomycetota bacterium]|jgi:REP element-mobilizing transposase RayT